MECLTLKAFIKDLQRFEETYGGDLPVLLADSDSPNVMCPIVDSFVIEFRYNETGEAQKIILVSNMVDDRFIRGDHS